MGVPTTEPPIRVGPDSPFETVSSDTRLSGTGPNATKYPLPVHGDQTPQRNASPVSGLASTVAVTEAASFRRRVVARLAVVVPTSPEACISIEVGETR